MSLATRNFRSGRRLTCSEHCPANNPTGELAAFIDLLAENERFDVLTEISAIYESLKRDDEGIKTAEIASAFPINAPELSVLMRELEAHFGERLEGKVTADPALIGGVRVTIGDRVFDASVRGKLDLMAVALKN